MNVFHRSSDGNAIRSVSATCILMLLTSLDVTIVNVALPAVQHDLFVSTGTLSWLVEGYSIPFATLMLSGGALTDRIGPSRTFTAGIVAFGLGSLCAAAAPTFLILVASRVLQGIGAAVCTPSALAYLRSNVPVDELGRAVAYWAFSGSVAISAGPILGGILIETVGWRGIFVINIPIVMIAICLVLPQARNGGRRPLSRESTDILGQSLYAAASLMLVSGLVAFHDARGHLGWAGPATMVVAAICGFSLFYLAQRRATAPVLPISLWRNSAFSTAAIVGGSLNAVNFGLLYCLGLYYGGAHGFTAMQSGLLFLPMMLATAISTLTVEPIRRSIGDHKTVATGLAMELLGAVLIVIVADSALGVAISTVPMGFGVGLVIPPLTRRLLGGVSAELSGVASGAFSSIRQLGGAVGVAIFGFAIHGASTSISVDIRLVSIVCACLILVALSTCLFASGRPAKARKADVPNEVGQDQILNQR